MVCARCWKSKEPAEGIQTFREKVRVVENLVQLYNELKRSCIPVSVERYFKNV